MFNEGETPDPILYWNDILNEVQRRDFTFDDAEGDDERGTPMDRQQSTPAVGGPTRVSRAFAIVNLAIYDALLSVDRPKFEENVGSAVSARLQPYLADLVPPSPAVSRSAAVAGAASVTIQHLFGGTLAHEAVQDVRLLLYRAGEETAKIDGGLAYGAEIGRRLLDERSNDGAEDSRDALYRPFALPGLFRPDPYNPAQDIVGPTWGEVSSFGGQTLSEIKFCGPLETLGGASKPPDEEELGEYRCAPKWEEDLNLVRRKGASPEYVGLDRTPEETLIGIFWGYDGVRNIGVPPRLYNQCLIAIARAAKLEREQNAILFSLGNLAMADAGIACWHEKYTYHVARPVTGIREEDVGFGPDRRPIRVDEKSSAPTFLTSPKLPIDATTCAQVERWLELKPDNPSLKPDGGHVTWAPLGAPQTNTRTANMSRGLFNRSPGFPAYPSGHATFGAACFSAAAELLKEFGMEKPSEFEFTFVSDEFDGVNRDPDGSIRPLHRRRMTLGQAIHENAFSRVYLGVHWRMDAIEGVRLGIEVLNRIKAKGRGPAAVLGLPAAEEKTAQPAA